MIIYELFPDGSVNRISRLPENARICCAFGCFDGVHVAHKVLLETAVRLARESDGRLVPAVWTFSEPVSKPWIISVTERLSICAKLGVRYAVCQEFSSVRELTPREFIGALAESVNLCHAVCGYDFKFGKNRSGDASVLKAELFGVLKDRGCTCDASPVSADKCVTVVDRINVLGDAVSSTRIRAMLAQGDVVSAKELLGRYYSIKGVIQSGNQIGRTISRPTANLKYSKDQLIPKRGVYFTYCRVKGQIYRAVTNIGYRPTVNSDQNDVTCEAHILDFEGAIYGETAEILFCEFAREERAFANVAELSEQINEDVLRAEEFFSKQNEGAHVGVLL